MSKAAKIWDEVIEATGEERIDKMSELAEALEEEANFDEAIAVHRLIIEEYLADERLEDWCNETWDLALLLRNQGEHFEAFELLRGSVDVSAVHATAYDHSYTLRLMGELLEAMGESSEAIEFYRRGAETLELTGYWAEIGWLQARIAQTAERLCLLEEGETAWGQAINAYELAGNLISVMRAGLEYGELLELLGKTDQARLSFENALTLARFHEDKDAEQQALHGLAKVHIWRREFSLAERLLGCVIGIKTNAGQKLTAAKALSTMANLRRAQGNETAALEFERQSLIILRALGA